MTADNLFSVWIESFVSVADFLSRPDSSEQREEVMTQIARQTQRTIARSQGQQQTKGEAVSV